MITQKAISDIIDSIDNRIQEGTRINVPSENISNYVGGEVYYEVHHGVVFLYVHALRVSTDGYKACRISGLPSAKHGIYGGPLIGDYRYFGDLFVEGSMDAVLININPDTGPAGTNLYGSIIYPIAT